MPFMYPEQGSTPPSGDLDWLEPSPTIIMVPAHNRQAKSTEMVFEMSDNCTSK